MNWNTLTPDNLPLDGQAIAFMDNEDCIMIGFFFKAKTNTKLIGTFTVSASDTFDTFFKTSRHHGIGFHFWRNKKCNIKKWFPVFDFLKTL